MLGIGKKTEKQPQYIKSPMNNNMLNYAVYYMTPTEKIGYTVLLLILGGLAGLVFYGGLFKVDGEATTATYISNCVVFIIIGFAAIRVFLPAIRTSLKSSRDNKLQKQFMSFLDNLSAALASGNTVTDAFANARNDLASQYSENEMIMVELSEILSGVRNGRTLEEMVASFGERSGNDDISNFSNVISNCYRLGGNFKDVVRKTRKIISDKMVITEEINTKLASNKLQHNAMSIMPILLVALLKMTSPMFANNLSSLTGVIITTIAVAVFVGAYFWGRKIIDIQ